MHCPDQKEIIADVTHFINKGQDLERIVLVRALKLHSK